ncbi:hypothetical protein MRB53_023836 [Persea americana]|uniref:Uncharacterized protein n=1 Tax=Persea americana TaxID=3435 RepID=A0ACC2LBI0_PERAE|nr:hypothetical protein MRB53_023836 [Persea americana]
MIGIFSTPPSSQIKFDVRSPMNFASEKHFEFEPICNTTQSTPTKRRNRKLKTENTLPALKGFRTTRTTDDSLTAQRGSNNSKQNSTQLCNAARLTFAQQQKTDLSNTTFHRHCRWASHDWQLGKTTLYTQRLRTAKQKSTLKALNRKTQSTETPRNISRTKQKQPSSP